MASNLEEEVSVQIPGLRSEGFSRRRLPCGRSRARLPRTGVSWLSRLGVGAGFSRSGLWTGGRSRGLPAVPAVQLQLISQGPIAGDDRWQAMYATSELLRENAVRAMPRRRRT